MLSHGDASFEDLWRSNEAMYDEEIHSSRQNAWILLCALVEQVGT
jgi:hypothetical protein